MERKNGFRERHIPLDSANPDDLAISRHHFAQYILASKGSYAPSLEQLKAIPDAQPVETLSIIDDKIRELKRHHQEDIDLLTAFQAAEYRQEVLDRYNCIDDSVMELDAEDQIRVEYFAALNELYNDARPVQRVQHDMDDALSQIRYNYLQSLLSLLTQRRQLKMRESHVRSHRDGQFPQNIEEYQHIPERDTQLRIARFLMRSSSDQEKMVSYGWTWRVVEPLVSAFKTNECFKNEILESVKDAQASDPRRRPTATPGQQM